MSGSEPGGLTWPGRGGPARTRRLLCLLYVALTTSEIFGESFLPAAHRHAIVFSKHSLIVSPDSLLVSSLRVTCPCSRGNDHTSLCQCRVKSYYHSIRISNRKIKSPSSPLSKSECHIGAPRLRSLGEEGGHREGPRCLGHGARWHGGSARGSDTLLSFLSLWEAQARGASPDFTSGQVTWWSAFFMLHDVQLPPHRFC